MKRPKTKRPVLWSEYAIQIYSSGGIDWNGFNYFLRRGLKRSCWQCLVKNLKRRGYKFYRKPHGGQ